jgi:FSR family fosmidomycin resistance protein-like MFS transporter
VLLSLPAVFGSLLEPPLGLLGHGWNRRALVRGGGVAFAVGLVLVALGGGFVPLLLAMMLLSPASGAFVGLSQTVLMDMAPDRHEQNMARWVLAGSVGVLIGPLALSAAAFAGFGWRAAFGSFALITLPVLGVVWRMPMERFAEPGVTVRAALRSAGREALRSLRRREVIRWLSLLQLADLMLDVLHGFLALYFVDVVGLTGAQAAFAILVWTGVGLVGDALLIPLLERVEGTRYLRVSAACVLVVFPAFLLLDGTAAKLLLLGALGFLNAGWYSVLQGRLYTELPGQSATVMALGSVFGTVGGILPLTIGWVAQQLGLAPALWLLLAGPVALLIGLPRNGPRRAAPTAGTDRGFSPAA